MDEGIARRPRRGAAHASRCSRAAAPGAGSAGPDEEIAAELEAAAVWLAPDAPGRAGLVAQLSADLSPDPADRQRRLVLAAENSADSENAVRLATQVLATGPAPNLQARATFVIADNLHGADPATLLRLLNGVDREHVDPQLATELLSRLTWTAMENADLTLLDRLIAVMGPASRGDDWVLLSAMGSALMFLGRNEPAVQALRRAAELSAGLDPAALSTDLLTGWAVIPGWLGEDDSAARSRFRQMDQLLRAHDRPIDQVYADFFGAERVRREGGWDRAISLLTHEIAILHALGYPEGVDEARLACLYAYRGDEEATRIHLSAAQRAFARRASPWLELWVTQARGALALTMGRPEEAVSVLGTLRAVPFLGRGCRDAVIAGLVDLVEALVEVGDRRTAAAVTAEVEARVEGLVDPLGRALVARCRALTQPGRRRGTPHPCIGGVRSHRGGLRAGAHAPAPRRAPAPDPPSTPVADPPHGRGRGLQLRGRPSLGGARPPRADRIG